MCGGPDVATRPILELQVRFCGNLVFPCRKLSHETATAAVAAGSLPGSLALPGAIL
jgi:hypothetical protein